MAGQTTNYLFDYPTSTDYVKDGATAIQTLATDVDTTLFTALGGAYPGLRLIKKQTIGSAVSAVTVTNAFSTTYQAYKIVISGGAHSSGNSWLNLTLGATATGYKHMLAFCAYGATALTVNSSAGTTSLNFAATTTASGLNMNLDVNSPFLTTRTFFNGPYIHNSDVGSIQGILDNSTSYTDFTLTNVSGTITGGTIYVYGYGAS